MSVGSSPASTETSLLRGLTAQQQVYLSEILDEYLQQLESGQAIPREQLLSRYPELSLPVRDALLLYLDKLEELYRVADFQSVPGGDLSGRVLGRYNLDREIGRGGMGIVFTAFEPDLDRQVAVKLLPMAAMLEPKYIERFRGEARAAASLQHPNIVPVYSIGEDSGIHYYAMRWIDGHSLDQRISLHRQRGTHPATNSALLQFADIAEALQEAHAFGIVHRDVKPSNLILDHDGKLWIADFGLARFQGSHGLTCTGEMVGTMRYMSPEQAAGRSEWVDHRTDIYSLGATLYEFLSGQAAIPGEEGPGILRTIATQTPTPIKHLRPELPADLQTVLQKAMARHRDDRYATAQEFAEDLRRLAYGQPISTRLVSRFVLAGRWMEAHSRMVSMLCAIIIAVVTLGAVAAFRVHHLISEAHELAVKNLEMAHAMERERSSTIDQLAMVPGVEDVRQRLIKSELEYYSSFVQQASRDSLMQGELARAYHRMACLTAELGNLQPALLHFARSEALYADLVDVDQLDSGLWTERCRNLSDLALAFSRAQQHDQAVDTLREWIRLLRLTPTQLQSNPACQLEYGWLENNYGLVLRKAGEAKRSLQESEQHRQRARLAFERAIAAFDGLEDDSTPQAQRGLAAALQNLGSLLSRGNSVEQQLASGLLDRALAIQEQLLDDDTHTLMISSELLATYNTLGYLHLQNNLSRAIESLQRAEKIGQRLLDIAPTNAALRRDMALALSNIGMAYYHNNQLELAMQALARSTEHYEWLQAKFPENQEIQASLAIALNNRGIVLQHSGDAAAAEQAYVRAYQLLESAAPAGGDSLDNVYINYARLLREMGRESEALHFEQGKLARSSQTQKDWHVKSES